MSDWLTAAATDALNEGDTMTASTGDVIEWSVTGEDPEPWIADLAPEWSREDAERYQRRHGGTVVCRAVSDWHVPGEQPPVAHDVIEQAARVIREATDNGADRTEDYARALADAGLLRQEPPTPAEIAWQVALAMDRAWDDATEYADLPSEAADAVLALLKGDKR